MDYFSFLIFVLVVILVTIFLIKHKPTIVEISDYMVSVPNRKIHYKWEEIKRIRVLTPRSFLFGGRTPYLNMNKGFEKNIKYIVTPKKGKIFIFKLSQVSSSHLALGIHSIPKLIERKKTVFGI